MRKLWTAFKNWLDETRMGMNLLAIERKHREAGAENPFISARQEVFIRAQYLERFRDEASEAYLRRNISLEKYREDFVKNNLMAKVSILDTQTTAQVRNIIRNMPHEEAYHGEALRKWQAEFAAWLQEMKEANKRLNGPSGMDERTKRVLRARV